MELDDQKISILAISKGLGALKRSALNSCPVHIIYVQTEEPLDPQSTAHASAVVVEEIDSKQPALVIAASRGGRILASVLQQGAYTGPSLLISAMDTSRCCEAETPLLILHGSIDSTNAIDRVKQDVDTCPTARLVEFQGFDHSLNVLNDPETMMGYIQEAIQQQYAPRKKIDQGVKQAARNRNDILAQLRRK